MTDNTVTVRDRSSARRSEEKNWYSGVPKVRTQKLSALALARLKQRENTIVRGPSGTGKAHFAHRFWCQNHRARL